MLNDLALSSPPVHFRVPRESGGFQSCSNSSGELRVASSHFFPRRLQRVLPADTVAKTTLSWKLEISRKHGSCVVRVRMSTTTRLVLQLRSSTQNFHLLIGICSFGLSGANLIACRCSRACGRACCMLAVMHRSTKHLCVCRSVKVLSPSARSSAPPDPLRV